jgi:hypothetical protein
MYGLNLTLDDYKHDQQPISNMSENPLQHIIGGWRQHREFAKLVPSLSDQVDHKAPGVREHQIAPPISFGPFRGSAYDQQRAGNQAPMPDYNDTLGEMETLFGPWAQRAGASNYHILRENIITEHPAFRNTTLNYNAALTGVSQLKDFRPNSTLSFIH